MNTTMYVVNGFHQGRRLRPQYFSCEVQAQACAVSMSSVFDGVALATTTQRSLAQRCDATRIAASVQHTPPPTREHPHERA